MILFLTVLSTKVCRITLEPMSTKAGHVEFQALPSDFRRAGCIYPKIEANLYGTITIKWMKVFQEY